MSGASMMLAPSAFCLGFADPGPWIDWVRKQNGVAFWVALFVALAAWPVVALLAVSLAVTAFIIMLPFLILLFIVSLFGKVVS